ncbi:MAG: hypothetical protein HGA51_03360 [Demequinaceae bacterium]|nr:hypothetical protein [Demequinaceae bacterium]
MSDLVIRGDALHGHARKMRLIAADVASAHDQADDAARAVGHDGLARTVSDFGSQWDIHRHRLIDEVSTLADTFDAINNTIADLEGDMASRMRIAAEKARAATPGSVAGASRA